MVSTSQNTAVSHVSSDTKTEIVIGNLLRIGVSLSALTVLAGGALYLRQFGMSLPHHQVFQGEPSQLRSITGILSLAFHGDPHGIISLGILLLIATPVLRVGFSVWAFACERDRFYVGITLVVLALLLYSLSQA